MCSASGCFPSAATGRPNVFGKTSESPRKCGTCAASSSGPTIVLKRQGMSLCSLGSNGSSARAVEQLLHQLRLRRWRWQMKSCPTKTKTHSSERDPGCWAQGGPACHPEAVSAVIIMAVVEWRLMIEANTWRTHWQSGVGNEKIEIICKIRSESK